MSANQLGNETSPYLLQHKSNPVHWWPWTEAALKAARDADKPIMLSIGYAACHWCHVMAHESFENEAIADLLNEKFINIKVDREERPDIDHIYMSALQHFGEEGGWPLTIFLRPDAKPYWGGTYFPPEAGLGRPSFTQAIEFAEKIYREDKETVNHNAENITQLIAPERPKMMGPVISNNILRNVAQRLGDMMDNKNGGLRGAPKFPQYPLFNFIWRLGLRYDLDTAINSTEHVLMKIFEGGIYDHIGGGLARYSVDEKWLVPHFEKMLYDNALMIELATEVFKRTKTPLLATRIEEIIEWALREMITEGGAFSASLDADSEGIEGKFYVWSATELKDALGDDYAFFAVHYDISDEGNFEGKNIPNRLNAPTKISKEQEADLKFLREKLFKIRENRIKPDLDDKILTDWNGMMITSLTIAGETFDREEWIDLAVNAYDFIKSKLHNEANLSHSYRLGKISSPGIAGDYAQMIRAAIKLYQVKNQQTYLDDALNWLETLNKSFWCDDHGGYFMTADTRNDLIVRGKIGMDEATPNANAAMISNLMSLFLITGNSDHREKAQKTSQCFGNAIAKNIFSHVGLLSAGIDILSPAHLIISYEDENDPVLAQMRDSIKMVSVPNLVVEHINFAKNPEKAKDHPAIEGNATAYLCVGETCLAPINSALSLQQALMEAPATNLS